MIGDMSCGVGQATTQHHFVEMYTSLCVHFNDWCSEHLKAGHISISAFLAKQMESVEIWDHQFTRLVSKDLSRSSSSWRSKSAKSLCSTRHIPEKVGKFKPVLLQQCQDSVLWYLVITLQLIKAEQPISAGSWFHSTFHSRFLPGILWSQPERSAKGRLHPVIWATVGLWLCCVICRKCLQRKRPVPAGKWHPWQIWVQTFQADVNADHIILLIITGLHKACTISNLAFYHWREWCKLGTMFQTDVTREWQFVGLSSVLQYHCLSDALLICAEELEEYEEKRQRYRLRAGNSLEGIWSMWSSESRITLIKLDNMLNQILITWYNMI